MTPRPSSPVAVAGRASPGGRRRLCAVAWCGRNARADGLCWSHRVDRPRVRAVARLAAGVDVDQVVAVTGLPEGDVARLAVEVLEALRRDAP